MQIYANLEKKKTKQKKKNTPPPPPPPPQSGQVTGVPVQVVVCKWAGAGESGARMGSEPSRRMKVGVGWPREMEAWGR